MAILKLPKQLHPEIRPRHIPHGNMVLDRDDPFGSATTWAFLPGIHDPQMHAGISAAFPIGFQTLGQAMDVQMVGTNSGDTYGISEYSGDSWGYSGLIGNLKDQSNDSGSKFFFGSGIQGQIAFENKQSWSIWGLVKPLGNGKATVDGDPRIFSRDQGSAANDHAYMIGGVNATPSSRTRCDIGAGGTTTLVGGLQWNNDELVMIVSTYDGSTLSIHTLLEDGQYDVNTTAESGDINDNSSSSYGLNAGANHTADNGFEGEILGIGVLNYPLDEAGIREFTSDITRIVKPAVPLVYTYPVTAGGLNISPNTITSDEVVFNPIINLGSISVIPTTITSDEVVFNPTISTLLNVIPNTITSDEIVFNPSISVGSISVLPNTITTGEVVFTVEVLVDTILVLPDTITSDEIVFNPTISVGAVTVIPNTITSDEVVFNPVVDLEGAILTVDDPVDPGVNSHTVSGFDSAINAGRIFSGTAEIDFSSANDTTATLPAIADTNNAVPFGSVTYELTDGSETKTIATNYDAPAGYAFVALTSGFTTGPETFLFDYAGTPDIGDQFTYLDANLTLFSDGTMSGDAGTYASFAVDISDAQPLYEAFDIILELSIAPNTITSDEVVFNPTISTLLNVSPNTITSDEVVFNPVIVPGAITVTPNTITSDEVVFAVEVLVDTILVSPEIITSDEVVFNPTISVGVVTVIPNTITSGEVVFTVEVLVDTILVSPETITSDEVVFNPSISVGAVIVSPNTIASNETFYAPAIVTSITVAPNTITSDEVVFNPELDESTILTPNTITSDEVIFNPTISVGSVTVTPNTITSDEVVYNLQSIEVIVLTIEPESITSDEVIYLPVMTTGEVIVSPNTIASNETVYTVIATLDSEVLVFENPSLTVTGSNFTDDVTESNFTITVR